MKQICVSNFCYCWKENCKYYYG